MYLWIKHGAKACPIFVSYLRNAYLNEEGKRVLAQGGLTDWREYATFAEFVADLWSFGRYPSPQAHKLETYGWTPTLFLEGGRPISPLHSEGRWGHWRLGKFAANEVS